MTRDAFWDIIEEARQSVGKTSEIPGWLENRLSQLPEGEIADFDAHFGKCRDLSYDGRLWLAAVVILGGCGDDSFDYFRGWLIAQGRKVFEAALVDPDSLAELELAHFDGDPRLEEMLYVANGAHCRAVGRDRHDLEARARFEALQPPWVPPTLKRSELVQGSDEDAIKLFPRLAARFPAGIRSTNQESHPPLFPRCD
jgi:hypothetical protein